MVKSLSFYTLNVKIPEISPFGISRSKQGERLHFQHWDRLSKHPHSNKPCYWASLAVCNSCHKPQSQLCCWAVSSCGEIDCYFRRVLLRHIKSELNWGLAGVEMTFVIHEIHSVNLWRLFACTGFDIHASGTMHSKRHQTKPGLVLIWIVWKAYVTFSALNMKSVAFCFIFLCTLSVKIGSESS